MKKHVVTIVSELDDDLQAWTLCIDESDLVELMKKYDGKGCSVLGDADDIAEEIRETYKNK